RGRHAAGPAKAQATQLHDRQAVDLADALALQRDAQRALGDHFTDLGDDALGAIDALVQGFSDVLRADGFLAAGARPVTGFTRQVSHGAKVDGELVAMPGCARPEADDLGHGRRLEVRQPVLAGDPCDEASIAVLVFGVARSVFAKVSADL